MSVPLINACRIRPDTRFKAVRTRLQSHIKARQAQEREAHVTEQTISSRFYTDESCFEFDKEQIFYKTWQFVGHISQLAKAGDYFTTKVADENLLIVKGEDEAIRTFFNVCRHRAHAVASGSGNRKLFVCPYHAWSYRLNGALHRAPVTENVEGFCKNDITLREIRTETKFGMIFVNLDDDALSINETYPGVEEAILSQRPGIASMKKVFERSVEHECNWKISVENYNECYHCPTVHATSITRLYLTDSYTCDLNGPVTKHFMARKDDRDVHGDMHSWFLFPNTIVEVFPLHNAVSLRTIVPLGVDKSVYYYSWYVPSDLSDDAVEEVVAMGQNYCDTVCVEDASVVEAVHIGMKSRSFDTGPLIITPQSSPQNENATAHFQSRYKDAVIAAGEKL
ncbi:aromatic ring-hydroxylating oxygenase subunit alpha [Defluviimonas sp. SAOS-178_SWC]|uniref:aromatic ring-hydroxylating oxygenase subunit alpha n=1 Tax=Defluviimonas sp. SAOS-178_SWC TaxID=3121287 RepID=UPI003221D81B